MICGENFSLLRHGIHLLGVFHIHEGVLSTVPTRCSSPPQEGSFLHFFGTRFNPIANTSRSPLSSMCILLGWRKRKTKCSQSQELTAEHWIGKGRLLPQEIFIVLHPKAWEAGVVLAVEIIQRNCKPRPKNISSNRHGENHEVQPYWREIFDDGNTIKLLISKIIMGVSAIRSICPIPGRRAKDVAHRNVCWSNNTGKVKHG